MNEDQDKSPSRMDRIKPRLRSAAKYAASGVAGGVAVFLATRPKAGIIMCHVTMEQINKLQEQGQGVIVYMSDSRNPIWFALPDKD